MWVLTMASEKAATLSAKQASTNPSVPLEELQLELLSCLSCCFQERRLQVFTSTSKGGGLYWTILVNSY